MQATLDGPEGHIVDELNPDNDHACAYFNPLDAQA